MPTPRMSEDGTEPDYRFSLANERTFLAWLRTALGLLAAAVAVTQLTSVATHPRVLDATAAGLAIAGTALAGLAYRRWSTVQRAMRRAEPLPMSWVPAVFGAAIAVAIVVVVAVALLSA